ncbi:NlpC/P60 family protein [Oricola sp.]|uniref:NlpC/P60 family protein n=1 Tax=Oricola sp. TaxID=1979950 RepID=UPI0025ECF612|nr:NlpC/P60 family protein [Oricola sp.]MCI5078739.1 NlpC/P60 family protein [Oricola sp.]
MSFIGIPFRERDGGRAGTHCWGLVRLVYRENHRIELPEHAEIGAHEVLSIARETKRQMTSRTWLRVDEPRYPDVAVMSALGGDHPVHVGVVFPELRLLHLEERTASVCVPLAHPVIEPRLLGFFRHEAFR